MRTFPVLLALTLSLFASSTSAQTPISGVVTALYASPGSQAFDPRQCTFFQVNNALQWYAIPLNDPGYESELIILRDSFEFQRVIGFWTYSAYPVCGSASAFDLYAGTPNW
jgi:hypothetical protein